MLDVFGAGTINNPTGSGYLFDKASIQLVLLHPSEARSPLTRVEKLSAFRLGVFSHFYLMRLADLVKTDLFRWIFTALTLISPCRMVPPST